MSWINPSAVLGNPTAIDITLLLFVTRICFTHSNTPPFCRKHRRVDLTCVGVRRKPDSYTIGLFVSFGDWIGDIHFPMELKEEL